MNINSSFKFLNLDNGIQRLIFSFLPPQEFIEFAPTSKDVRKAVRQTVEDCANRILMNPEGNYPDIPPIMRALGSYGITKKLIAFCKMIDSNASDAIDILTDAALDSIRIGKFKEAMEIVEMISGDLDDAHLDIALALIQYHQINEAKSILDRLNIYDDQLDDAGLKIKEIILTLLEKEYIDQAMNLIPFFLSREELLHENMGTVVSAFITKGRIDEATLIINLVHEFNIRMVGEEEDLLLVIMHKIMEKNSNHIQSLDLLIFIKEKIIALNERRDLTYSEVFLDDFEEIVAYLIKNEKVKDALEFALTMHPAYTYCYENNAKAFIKAGEFEKALQIASYIPTDEQDGVERLVAIAKQFINRNRIEFAEKIADRFTGNEEFHHKALASISVLLRKKGEDQAAEEILQKIPEDCRWLYILWDFDIKDSI